MKKTIALSIAIASSASMPMMSQAAPKIPTEAKQVSVFTSAGVLGAIAGGPIGLFVGAIGGAYLGEQIKKADQLEDVNLAREQAQKSLASLNDELVIRESAIEQLQQQTLDQLQLQVLFTTASDQLVSQHEKQLQALAEFLNNNRQLQIHLHGYADPRGTEDYNEVLSHYRASSVKHLLVEQGIEDHRIRITAHGANQEKSPHDSADTYALQRRVDIEISNPKIPVLSMQ
jgi:outer membrane protein OmpA-like peptidoglycan-associated protein